MSARTKKRLVGALLAAAMYDTAAQTKAAPRPDDPYAPVALAPYVSVLQGAKTFVPVLPMPWGEVNRRVMPVAPLPSETPR